MRKRILSMLCVLALCLTLLPVTALAADEALVATVEIGGTTTYYYEGTGTGDGTHIYKDTAAAAFQAAWSACASKTATLTLKQNVELNSQLTVKSGAMTLCMDDGVTLSSSVTQSTIKNTSTNGSLDFRSGTIQTTQPIAIECGYKSAKVTLSGGNIISSSLSSSYGAIYISAGEFRMTGGSVQTSGSSGVYINGQSSIAVISGGEISSQNYGICASKGQVEISGDVTITSTGNYAMFVNTSSAKVKLSGGTYIWAGTPDPQKPSNDKGSIWVSSGTVGNLLETGCAYYKLGDEGQKVENTAVDILKDNVIVKADSQVELSIIENPKSLDVQAGSPASFSVQATGDVHTYQWQVSEDGSNNWKDITGADQATYTIDEVTKDLDDNQYRCVVSDSAGNSKTSTAATLTVYDYYTLKVQQGKITDPESTSAEVKIKEGEQVTIRANGTSTDQRFKEWTWTSTDALTFVGGTSKTSSTASFTMPECDVTITATYEKIPEHTLTVVNGIGGGTYKEGAVIGIQATPPEGYKFQKWTWDTNKISAGELFAYGDSQDLQNSGIYMPTFDFTITATFVKDDANYALTVDGGDGDGTYKVSTPVSITALAKNDEDMPFWKWTSSGGGTFANESFSSTTFTMPAESVTVTAHYYDQVISIDGYMDKDDFYAKLPDTVKLDDDTEVSITWTCSSLDSKAYITEAGGYTFTAQYAGTKPAEWPAEGIEYGVYAKQTMVQVWLGSSNYHYDASAKKLTVTAGGETYELSFGADITTLDGCNYVYLPTDALVQHTYEDETGYRLYMTITGEGAENAYPVLRSVPGYQSEEEYESGKASSTIIPQSYLSDAEPGASQYALLVTIDRYGAMCVTFDTSAPLAFEGAGTSYSLTFRGDVGDGRTYGMAAADGSGTSFGALGKVFFTVTPPTGEERAWAVLIVPSDEVTSGSTGSGVTVDTSWGRTPNSDMSNGHNYMPYSLFQNEDGQFVAAYLEEATTAVISEITLTADNKYAAKGEQVTLSVTADYQFKDLKGMPGVSYQWYECDADGSNGKAISGATGAAYTTSFSEFGTHYYYVTAKFNQFTEGNGYHQGDGTPFSDYDSFGWASDTVTTSDVITLTVGRGVELSATVNKTVLQAGETLTVNATVKPEAGATGTPTGTVTLYMGDPNKGGKELGQETISNGKVSINYTITKEDVARGPDQTLYLVYSGDSIYRSETITEEIDLLGGLTITAVARDGEVIISWEQPQGYDNITGYELYADKEGLATMPVNPIEIDKDATSYTVAHLQDGSAFENGTVYDFVLKAIYTDGEIVSNKVSAMPNPVYAITVETDGHGTATSSPADSAAEGSVVTLTATPDRGYRFARWEVVSGSVTIEDDSFTMPGEAVTVKAIFERSSTAVLYPITVKDADNGTVTCYAHGAAKDAEVTLHVKADVGYQLASLTVTDADGNARAVTKVDEKTYTFVMPACAVTVEAVFAPITSGLPFTDVNTGDWFYDAVKFVYENGLMDGVGNNLFAPNAVLTRAMAVTILYRLEGSPAVTTDAGFNDVAAGTWYTDAVNWAAANNIVNGVENNNFNPNGSLTREQMATVLYRYAQYKGADVSASGDISGFADSANVSSWAVDAVKWAVGSGLVNGVEGNALAPQGTSTRAQAATVLMRFMG